MLVQRIKNLQINTLHLRGYIEMKLYQLTSSVAPPISWDYPFKPPSGFPGMQYHLLSGAINLAHNDHSRQPAKIWQFLRIRGFFAHTHTQQSPACNMVSACHGSYGPVVSCNLPRVVYARNAKPHQQFGRRSGIKNPHRYQNKISSLLFGWKNLRANVNILIYCLSLKVFFLGGGGNVTVVEAKYKNTPTFQCTRTCISLVVNSKIYCMCSCVPVKVCLCQTLLRYATRHFDILHDNILLLHNMTT